MQPRLQMTTKAKYVPAPYSGTNESGVIPVGDRVLVKPDVAAAEANGIYFTEEHVERMTLAAETGVLVAVGAEAFRWNSDRTRLWEGAKPEIGQRVFFERYAGMEARGSDGAIYRVMDDKCIGALVVIEQQQEEASNAG